MVVGFEATMSGRLADITNSETETVALKPIVAPELTTMPHGVRVDWLRKDTPFRAKTWHPELDLRAGALVVTGG